MSGERLVRPATAGFAAAGFGVGATIVSSALIAALHVVPPSNQVDPVRRTISQYALLDNGWLFDVGVLALAVGSLGVLAALVASRLVRVVSLGAVGMVLWSAGLAGVVYFEKHNWSVGPSWHGDVHRVASLIAFLSLPMAALAIGGLWWRDDRWRVHARTTVGLGLLGLLSFAPIVIAIVTEPWTGVRWWRAIPLGGVERVLAVSEVVAVLALGVWAAKASLPSYGRPAPALDSVEDAADSRR